MGSLDLILGGNGVNGGLEQSHDVIYFIVYKDYQGRRGLGGVKEVWEGKRPWDGGNTDGAVKAGGGSHTDKGLESWVMRKWFLCGQPSGPWLRCQAPLHQSQPSTLLALYLCGLAM